uniref:NADP-dependent oxidoreductase domain-containing protein n=1 Tax=Junco hyemalis TaxID=40217 RepID=A0A8C5IGW7_JUNHY
MVASGKSVYKDQFGKDAFSPLLTILNDPIISSVQSTPFDTEGNATEKFMAIDHGRLRCFFLDTEYGEILNIRSNSCATYGIPESQYFVVAPSADNTSLGLIRLGQGTWHFGENRKLYEAEIESIRYGIQNGVTLIDTAEMYGDGKSESLIGEAIKDFDRSRLYIVSKILPWNAGYDDFFISEIPLEETIRCMEEAKRQGLIKDWGVSNFDIDDMQELLSLKDGYNCRVDQCLYHLGSRGVEYSLIPFLKNNAIRFMSYCPLAEAGSLKRELLSNSTVIEISKEYGITPIQLLLAFTLRDKDITSIPKASHVEHLKMNIEASKIQISDESWKLLDSIYPSPKKKLPLDME